MTGKERKMNEEKERKKKKGRKKKKKEEKGGKQTKLNFHSLFSTQFQC